jgi:hypothetical protein
VLDIAPPAPVEKHVDLLPQTPFVSIEVSILLAQFLGPQILSSTHSTGCIGILESGVIGNISGSDVSVNTRYDILNDIICI